MSLERRRAVLEAILAADDTTAPDRLRAIEALAELDRIETEARFTRQASEPHVERDPQRIEKIMQLALEHVGADLIERRAQEIAGERRSECSLESDTSSVKPLEPIAKRVDQSVAFMPSLTSS